MPDSNLGRMADQRVSPLAYAQDQRPAYHTVIIAGNVADKVDKQFLARVTVWQAACGLGRTGMSYLYWASVGLVIWKKQNAKRPSPLSSGCAGGLPQWYQAACLSSLQRVYR